MTALRKKTLLSFLAAVGALQPSCHKAPDVVSRAPSSQAPPVVGLPIAEALSRFGFELYQKMREVRGNLCVSPANAALTLVVTLSGARGATRAEMARALHFEGDPAQAEPLFRAVRGKSNGSSTFRASGHVWVQTGMPLRPEFLTGLRDTYQTPIQELDFRATERARAAINRWVSSETNGHIEEIIPPGALDEDARLVAAEALYLHGLWARAFLPSATHNATFATATGKVETPTMHQQNTYAYRRVGKLQVLELPYQDRLSMVIILPDTIDGVPAIEEKLASDTDEWLNGLQPTLIELALPRWKSSTALSLDRFLKALGISSAFSRLADFSGMTMSEPIHIDTVLHQTAIEVNESGTEAAAATAVAMYGTAFHDPPVPVIVRVDHPFVYFIRDSVTGVVWFVGRVVDPRS